MISATDTVSYTRKLPYWRLLTALFLRAGVSLEGEVAHDEGILRDFSWSSTVKMGLHTVHLSDEELEARPRPVRAAARCRVGTRAAADQAGGYMPPTVEHEAAHGESDDEEPPAPAPTAYDFGSMMTPSWVSRRGFRDRFRVRK
ncbi:hypothetical protein NE237_014480 [Protea cynaroides]|uniref:Uncharacterized protein n=1 Tax=Protea cynaroides TaxID=273540 RepID=A0A9Q0KC97_9MAGN|nr:hypothetical protein NE237_014480 [Protea cynaroides]